MSSPSGTSSNSKWSCTRCTYENFPRSIRCTLCGAASPKTAINTLIEEEAERPMTPPPAPPISLNQQQSMLANASSGSNLNSSALSDSLSNLALNITVPSIITKWPCRKCTYLNWPKSSRCTQCHSARPEAYNSNTASPAQKSPSWNNLAAIQHSLSSEGLSSTPERANVTPSPVLGVSSPLARSPSPPARNSPEASTSNLVCGATSMLAQSDSCSGGASQSKWSCPTCTYVNWPKSQRCVMCATFRHNLNNSISSRSNSPPVIIETGAMAMSHGENEDARTNNYISTIRNCSNSKSRNTSSNIISTTSDRLWWNACLGVIEGNIDPVNRYIEAGRSIDRVLTHIDCQHIRTLWLHHQNSGPLDIKAGLTLLRLADHYQRNDISMRLSFHDSVTVAKRVPSEVCADIAADIRRTVAASFKQRKGTEFACFFVTDNITFALPSEIEHLHPSVQKKLFDELLDNDVQKELEEESQIINWSLELTQRLGSRLYALWNRSAGDCLLDSVLQATWGVFDRDNTLRRVLADSLGDAAGLLYPRWREAEAWQADLMHYSLAEAQWQEDWAILVSLASQPGAALEQLHIFTLAHIFRRPIIVYGVKCIKSFRGEDLGLARFEGIYLPLLWECPSFCWKSPIALGYTRGHFSALVPIEPSENDMILCGGAHSTHTSRQDDIVYLPLMTSDGKLLPIHFLTKNEMGREEELIREWLDFRLTEGGLLVALQKLQPPLRRPNLVNQMLDEWLHLYRNLSIGKNVADVRFSHLLQNSLQSGRNRSSDPSDCAVSSVGSSQVERGAFGGLSSQTSSRFPSSPQELALSEVDSD